MEEIATEPLGYLWELKSEQVLIRVVKNFVVMDGSTTAVEWFVRLSYAQLSGFSELCTGTRTGIRM